MSALDIAAAVGHIAEGNLAGFVYASLAAIAALWLLYRGTVARIERLETELAACNRKHEQTDRLIAAHHKRAENLGRSITALWTLLNLSVSRRQVKLPPLHEMLEGRIVLELRDTEPDAEERTAQYSAAATDR